MTAVLSRGTKSCSFIEMRGLKLVYKRYASLYFCAAIDVRCREVDYEPLNIFALQAGDNELIALEIIHRYVELLDKYFGSVSFPRKIIFNSSKPVLRLTFQVCELDIIFNFEKAYFMLDELLIGGEVQETSKKNVLKAIAAQDLLQEV